GVCRARRGGPGRCRGSGWQRRPPGRSSRRPSSRRGCCRSSDRPLGDLDDALGDPATLVPDLHPVALEQVLGFTALECDLELRLYGVPVVAVDETAFDLSRALANQVSGLHGIGDRRNPPSGGPRIRGGGVGRRTVLLDGALPVELLAKLAS